jgi:hypothetical protein
VEEGYHFNVYSSSSRHVYISIDHDAHYIE